MSARRCDRAPQRTRVLTKLGLTPIGDRLVAAESLPDPLPPHHAIVEQCVPNRDRDEGKQE